MGRTTKPNFAVVELLKELLELARAGEIDEVFVLARFEGEASTLYEVNDLDDVLYDLGTAILTERIEKKSPA